jgi:hypothetical protein
VAVNTSELWLTRRLFVLLSTAALVVIGMIGSILVGPHWMGHGGWAVPRDLWGLLIAAQRLVGLHLDGLYTAPTGLITFPGAAVILAPVAVAVDAANLSLRQPGADNLHPGVWLVAGPYLIIISAVALLAADALAERLQVGRAQRAVLALAGGAALWNVTVQWGHPEDAVAVGLLLFTVLALSSGRLARGGWLIGAAVAVQPLVLLALPVLLAVVAPRRWVAFLLRVGTPAAVLFGAAVLANPGATWHAVTRQPNWPAVDHPTPWTSLVVQLGGGLANGGVAAGPARALAILAACGCGLIVGRRRVGPIPWSPAVLREVLWWVAMSLALRSLLEPVMVAFYLWPPLAVALIVAADTWRRLIPTSTVAIAVSFGSQASWHNMWGWWGLVMAGLVLTLCLAGVTAPRDTSTATPAATRSPS